MKIVADRNIPFLEGRIEGATLERLPAPEIDREAVRDADALIVRTRTVCNASLLEGSKVRLVATATIGTDHIDLPWCAANGITVRNAPGSNAPGVALYVWASLLRNGFKPGKSILGVVGYGHVGQIVAEWGRRLGASVIVCDPPRSDAGFADVEYLPLEEVMRRSDALTLHTPLTGAHAEEDSPLYPTYHMIGKESLRHLKPGAMLVNAARGEVLDTKAVIDALRERRIGKAVIDTWECEPHISPELLRMAEIATSHIAGYSVEGKQRATRMALEAASEFLGVPVDLSGLQGPYAPPAILTPERIVEAYNPYVMTEALKSTPEAFESLRNNYSLHKELL